MASKVKRIWVRWSILALGLGLAGMLAWHYSEPSYRGKPVSYWVTCYSRGLYPPSDPPIIPSQSGMEALEAMGPDLAAQGLTRAASRSEGFFYGLYRRLHRHLPDSFQNRYPLAVEARQSRTMALTASESLEPRYQARVASEIGRICRDASRNRALAGVDLLKGMAASNPAAMAALERLAAGGKPEVRDAARAALRALGKQPAR